jgi:NDP-sugar pyrophosphorylase family protein
MRALVLAAGRGERLRPITDSIPKVMVPVAGKPCLLYAIENLKRQGVHEIAVNTHYMADKVRDYFGAGAKFGVEITYSEEEELLGTSGALNNLRDYFDDTFIVAYGDVIADFEIEKLLEVHCRNMAEATIFLDSKRSAVGRGIADVEGEKVVGFIEKPQGEVKSPLINSGFYLLEPSVLERIPRGFSDFGKDILPNIARDRKLFFALHEGYIFDIGKLDDLRSAEAFLKGRA